MNQAVVNNTLVWGVFLGILTPLLVIVFGEVINRLRNQDSVYARFWQALRNLLLPLLVIFIIARQILTIADDTPQARLLETAVWAAIGVVVVSLLQAVGKASKDESRLEAEIPALVRGLLRMMAIVIPGYYILAVIWGVALGNLFAALGVGSLAIALALQDTLSNLVSGLLLTLDRPFEVGDQIIVEDHVGKVLDLNWRSVRVQVSGRDVITVPNSVLSKTAIYNYSTLDPSYRDSISVGFAYDVPPNRCLRLLEDTVATLTNVLTDPAPIAILEAFEGTWIRYDVYFYIAEFKGTVHAKSMRSELRSRVYYAAQREGLRMPYSSDYMGHPNVPSAETLLKFVAQQIRQSPLFRQLPETALQFIANSAQIQLYGRDETVIHLGKPSSQLYIILSGDAEMSTLQPNNAPVVLLTLSTGDVFGETALLGSRPSQAAIRALSDLQVIGIPKTTLSEIVERYAQFAVEFDRLVDDRRTLIRNVQGSSVLPSAKRENANGLLN